MFPFVLSLLFAISYSQTPNVTIFTFTNQLDCLKFDGLSVLPSNPRGLMFQTMVKRYDGCVYTVNSLAKYQMDRNGTVSVFACPVVIR
jgi:hypothetical protein